MPVRFQVDPDFYDHPKAIGMSDAATALWVRAGSYSAAKLTDGFIAEHVLVTLTRTPEEAADELTRRGLWRRVKGGYRFHQWDQRNLTKARVEGDRAADRKRKRASRGGQSTAEEPSSGAVRGGQSSDAQRKSKERHANRQTAGQITNGQVDPEIVQAESERTPDGIQPDSERIPPVSVSVSVSGSVSGSGRASGAGSEGPPPTRCPDHLDTPQPPPCGQCAEARKARERWDRDRASAAALEQQRIAHERAAAARAAIDGCRLCDHTGHRDGHLCAHDPTISDRSRRGAAAASAAIRRPGTSTPKNPKRNR